MQSKVSETVQTIFLLRRLFKRKTKCQRISIDDPTKFPIQQILYVVKKRMYLNLISLSKYVTTFISFDDDL